MEIALCNKTCITPLEVATSEKDADSRFDSIVKGIIHAVVNHTGSCVNVCSTVWRATRTGLSFPSSLVIVCLFAVLLSSFRSLVYPCFFTLREV